MPTISVIPEDMRLPEGCRGIRFEGEFYPAVAVRILSPDQLRAYFGGLMFEIAGVQRYYAVSQYRHCYDYSITEDTEDNKIQVAGSMIFLVIPVTAAALVFGKKWPNEMGRPK